MNLLPIFFIVLLAGFWSAKTEEHWVVKNESQITIQGSSNIGSYSCNLNKFSFIDTLYYQSSSEKIRFRPNRIALPVAGFNCNNSLMNRDFQDLLQARVHRYIFIELIEIDHPSRANGKVNGLIKITLIDKEKIYPVTFDHKRYDSVNFVLGGQAILNFSDFDLEAPRRFGGLIRIEESISVNFTLNIQNQVVNNS